MELLLALASFYALQCSAWVPRAGGLFESSARFGRRAGRARSGPGWQLRSWLPSTLSLVCAPLLVEEAAAGLRARSRPDRRGGPSGPGLAVERSALASAELRGTRIRVSGRTFARGLSRPHAVRATELLRGLAAPEVADARRQLASALYAAFDLPAFRDALAGARRCTRALAGCLDAYLALWLLVLPLLVLVRGVEAGLLLGLPLIGVTHGIGVVLLALAQRRLPDTGADRFEALLSAALFPPLLLRAANDLRAARLEAFHPAVAAAALLPEPARRAWLRRELAAHRYTSPAGADTPLGLRQSEWRHLVALVEETGDSVAALLQPPPRSDPAARSFCPVCLGEYRLERARCGDCQAATRPYSPPPSGARDTG